MEPRVWLVPGPVSPVISSPACGFLPVTVAERCRTCTVFARSEAGTVGLNPTQGMEG
jgi:hypothetical protein